MNIDDQIAYLTKGCVDVVRLEDLRGRLERTASGGQPLTVKVGFDPTAPDLHLGHTVLIRKMKHFQDLGHRVIFLIGDFTALIGDPTGRSKTRPPLTDTQIAENAETYKAQVFKLLDPDRTVVDFNSRWMSDLGSGGWIRLSARYNVAQMLERREFRQRYEKGQPIGIHEFMYPLAQAYDSVHLKVDVELGGTDQLFNLNVGRDIMKSFGMEAQVVLTTPLLVGLDGVEKMSKSAGNYVGITETPNEMFGKLMSISDELMWSYYELLTDVPLSGIDDMRGQAATGTLHPKQAKVDLAKRIIADFHSAASATTAAEEFERRFAKGALPSDLSEKEIAIPVAGERLTRLMIECGFADSSSSAMRLIDQGSVRIDGARVEDRWLQIAADRDSFVLQVGKRKVMRIRPVSTND
jgi:tyrosyl-tRNA synthetase